MWVAIIGSRDYAWPENVVEAVEYLCVEHPGWKLVSGAARGPDKWAADAARERDVRVLELPADWSLGRGAGFLRNHEIIGRADVVIAFWDGKSPGTRHSIGLARAQRKQLLVVGV